MKIINEKDLALSGEYVSLKKLGMKTGIRRGVLGNPSFKGNYLIDQKNGKLSDNKTYTIEKDGDVETLMFYTDELNGCILIETVYSERTKEAGAKLKAYLILDGVKYVLNYNQFMDTYKECMDILNAEIKNSEELKYIKAGYNNLEKTETKVDIALNLKRLEEFKDRANYKRNVEYFVINNTLASTTKFDIRDKKKIIDLDSNTVVLRYDQRDRLYYTLEKYNGKVELRETDLIIKMGEFTTVHIYTPYGLGKLLDIKNNVIPTKNNISLFANILDLGFKVLG